MDDEAAEIELLEQNLHKTRQTSQRMISLLNTFDTRLAKLEKTILPLYDSTQILNRRASNIEKALQKIDEVASNREGIEAEEALILRGPQPGQLEIYTDALGRLNASIAFNSSDRDPLDTSRLVETGAKKLCQLYTKLVAEGSSGPPSTNASFPPDLFDILEPLVAFLRTLPLPATHPSHPAAPAILSVLKEAQRGFADMRGNWGKKCLDGPGKRVLEAAEEMESVAAGREYGAWVERILDIALDEYNLLTALAPLSAPPALSSTYATLLNPLLTLFSTTTTSLVSLIKRSLHKHSFLALSASSALIYSQTRFTEVFRKRGEERRETNELKEGITSLRGVSHRSFPEFLADVKLAAMPGPGRVNDTGTEIADVTISTVRYLERLPDVQGAAAAALLALGDGNWKMGEGLQVGRGQKLGEGDEQIILEHFVYDIVTTLNSTLSALSSSKRPSFGAIFLMNNVSYLRTRTLVAPANPATPSLLSRPTKDGIVSSFRMAKAGYFDSNFSPLLQSLSEGAAGEKGVKPKDRMARFYDLLEEVLERHRLVAGTAGGGVLGDDGDEREELGEEVVKLVVPSLMRFLAKYREKEFSKNPQKYIKLSPDAVEQQLRNIYR